MDKINKVSITNILKHAYNTYKIWTKISPQNAKIANIRYKNFGKIRNIIINFREIQLNPYKRQNITNNVEKSIKLDLVIINYLINTYRAYLTTYTRIYNEYGKLRKKE